MGSNVLRVASPVELVDCIGINAPLKQYSILSSLKYDGTDKPDGRKTPVTATARTLHVQQALALLQTVLSIGMA